MRPYAFRDRERGRERAASGNGGGFCYTFGMSWASGRRALIIGGIAVFLLVVIGLIAYAVFHQAPSCTDGRLNQDEEGIDCGGSCTYLCASAATPPSVRFARALEQNGRTDVVAYIENPNAFAARAARYTIELYDANRALVKELSGTLDLSPRDNGVISLYVPGAYTGEATVAQAFVSLDGTSFKWFRLAESLVVPVAASPVLSGADSSPRVAAVFRNPSVTTIRKAKVIATVFDAEGNVMAASQTVLPDLGPGGSAEAVFTWNEPFPSVVSRIDVRPLLAVPAP